MRTNASIEYNASVYDDLDREAAAAGPAPVAAGKENKEMDMSKLATKMLEWEETKHQLAQIEEEIKTAVLAIGKTQTVGNVRASYSGGRKSYDYESAGRAAPQPVIDEHTITTTEVKIDWRAICKDTEAEVPYRQSPPKVTVKII